MFIMISYCLRVTGYYGALGVNVIVGNYRRVVYSKTPTVLLTFSAFKDIIQDSFPKFGDFYLLNIE